MSEKTDTQKTKRFIQMSNERNKLQQFTGFLGHRTCVHKLNHIVSNLLNQTV